MQVSKILKLTGHLIKSVRLIPKYFVERKLTWLNVKSFFQGTIRLYNFKEEPSHIQEQFYFRVGCANTTCLKEKKCFCGCQLPDMFLADKTCENKCYGILLQEEDWETFKLVFQEHVEEKMGLGKKYIESNLDLIP